MRFVVFAQDGSWPDAGIATGDRLVSWNGRPIVSRREFRAAITPLAIGDSVVVEAERGGVTRRAVVHVGSYRTHNVVLREAGRVTPRQLAVRRGAMLEPPSASPP